MKKKLILLVLGVVVVAALAVPFYMQTKLKGKLTQTQALLANNGVKIDNLVISGYFTSKVSMNYIITDGAKLKDFLFERVQQIDPSFQTLFPMNDDQTNEIINQMLNGTTFEGQMVISNLFPANSHIVVSLVKFSDEGMKEIEKDQELSDFLLPLLEKKMFTFIMDVDTDKRVKSIQIKDIKLAQTGKFDIQLLDNVLQLNYDKGINGTYTLGKQLYDISDSRRPLHVEIGKTLYTFEYLNQLNSKADISINNIIMNTQKFGTSSNLTVGNFAIKSKVGTKEDTKLNALAQYEIKDVTFQDKRANFTLGNTKLSINLEDLYKDNIQTLSDAYRNMLLQTDRYARRVATKDFAKAMQEFLNYGFRMKIDFSMNQASFNKDFMLNDIKGNLELKLAKNNLNLNQQRFTALLNFFDASGKVSMDVKDADMLKKFNIRFAKIIDLGLQEGDKKVYNIDFQNQNFYINNTKI